jgi:hypothetical protein
LGFHTPTKSSEERLFYKLLTTEFTEITEDKKSRTLSIFTPAKSAFPPSDGGVRE